MKMDSKVLKEIITCSICFEWFNEGNRCPRMLPCGHTYCNLCLLKIVKQTPSCPTCKTEIRQLKVKLIPVNFIVKGMIPLAKKDMEPETHDRSLQMQDSCSNPERFKSEGFCTEHSYFNELRCMDCKSWICAMCCSLNHKTCRTLLVKEAYSEIKELVFQTVDKELKMRVEISRCIPTTLDTLDEEKRKLLEEKNKLEAAIKACEKTISDLHSLITEESEYCTKLKRLRIEVENSSNSNEYTSAVKELTHTKVQGKMLLTKMKSLRFQNMKKFFDEIKMEPVYVVEDSPQKLYGQVEFNEGQIWIQSFQTEEPNGRPIPLKELLSECNITSDLPRNLFLKLSLEGESEYDTETIDVVIQTDGESLRAKNFALLCSGLVEQTYKGKIVDYYNNPSRFLLDSGPPPVVEGIRNSDPKIPWEEGFVSGMSEGNSFFNIAMEDISSYSKHKIGEVVLGLQKLKELGERNLIIKESGMVIYCNQTQSVINSFN